MLENETLYLQIWNYISLPIYPNITKLLADIKEENSWNWDHDRDPEIVVFLTTLQWMETLYPYMVLSQPIHPLQGKLKKYSSQSTRHQRHWPEPVCRLCLFYVEWGGEQVCPLIHSHKCAYLGWSDLPNNSEWVSELQATTSLRY